MEMRERLHLIGSIPLDSSEQVFRRLSDETPWLRQAAHDDQQREGDTRRSR